MQIFSDRRKYQIWKKIAFMFCVYTKHHVGGNIGALPEFPVVQSSNTKVTQMP